MASKPAGDVSNAENVSELQHELVARGVGALLNTEGIPTGISHQGLGFATCSSADAASAVPQVQTIKTAIEAACLLLRIDDIVSGIAKKSRGMDGPSMQQPQIEDADGVRTPVVTGIRR